MIFSFSHWTPRLSCKGCKGSFVVDFGSYIAGKNRGKELDIYGGNLEGKYDEAGVIKNEIWKERENFLKKHNRSMIGWFVCIIFLISEDFILRCVQFPERADSTSK